MYNLCYDVCVLDRKLDRACTGMMRVVKNVTWQKHITNEGLYAGLPRILTTIRGALGSAFIAAGVKMKLLVIGFVGTEA